MACEYCNLVSGQVKDIGNCENGILQIERHCNSYYISTTSSVDEDDERKINFCPLCGRKLGE